MIHLLDCSGLRNYGSDTAKMIPQEEHVLPEYDIVIDRKFLICPDMSPL